MYLSNDRVKPTGHEMTRLSFKPSQMRSWINSGIKYFYAITQQIIITNRHKAPFERRVDNAHHPLDSVIGFVTAYPMVTDSSAGG